MTLLFVFAVVFLSVRIAAVLVWVMHHHENHALAGQEERKTKGNRQLMTFRVPAQEYLTRDNVSVRVDAVVCYRIVDQGEAPTHAQNAHGAMSQLAQASLRSAIANAERHDLSSGRDPFTVEVRPTTEATRRGPQDAPRWGPHDADGNPQDATGEAHGVARAELTIDQGNHSVNGLEAPRERNRTVPDAQADPGPAIASPVRRGTTKAVRDFAAGRRMSFVKLGRDEASATAASDLGRKPAGQSGNTIHSSVSRPVKGPSCLGGRGDAGYLRGWDDAVDWIGQGNQAQPPTWGDVAYMTGWNDASRAMAKAGLGARSSEASHIASSS
jgi:hypothetical protein